MLTLREAVRKRPGMYVGGVDETGLHHLAFIALDQRVNSIVVHHTGPRTLRIMYETDWPLDADETRALFERFQGHESDDGSSTESDYGEWPWLGVVSALSESFVFSSGGSQGFTLINEDGQLVEKPAPCDNGVVLEFSADAEIFGEHEFVPGVISARLKHLAAFAPGARLRFQSDGETQEFTYPAGLRDLLVEEVHDELRIPEDPIVIQAAREDMRLDVAMVWLLDTQAVDVRVYANTVRNDGGAHLDGFLAGLQDFFGARGLSRPGGWTAGVFAICNVSVPREQYRNPTKSVLANPDVAPFVRELVAGALESWATENPDIAAELSQRMKWRQITDS